MPDTGQTPVVPYRVSEIFGMLEVGWWLQDAGFSGNFNSELIPNY